MKKDFLIFKDKIEAKSNANNIDTTKLKRQVPSLNLLEIKNINSKSESKENESKSCRDNYAIKVNVLTKKKKEKVLESEEVKMQRCKSDNLNSKYDQQYYDTELNKPNRLNIIFCKLFDNLISLLVSSQNKFYQDSNVIESLSKEIKNNISDIKNESPFFNNLGFKLDELDIFKIKKEHLENDQIKKDLVSLPYENVFTVEAFSPKYNENINFKLGDFVLPNETTLCSGQNTNSFGNISSQNDFCKTTLNDSSLIDIVNINGILKLII